MLFPQIQTIVHLPNQEFRTKEFLKILPPSRRAISATERAACTFALFAFSFCAVFLLVICTSCDCEHKVCETGNVCHDMSCQK